MCRYNTIILATHPPPISRSHVFLCSSVRPRAPLCAPVVQAVLGAL